MVVGVTGATGHLGTALCVSLIDHGYQVRALVNKDKSISNKIPVVSIEGNILDKPSLLNFMEGCDVVIHTAAVIDLGHKNDPRLYDVNVLGTENILKCAKEAKVKKVIHVSSIHAYAQVSNDTPIDEDSQYVSDNSLFYDQTKRDGHIIAELAAKSGQDVVIVCPTSILGSPDYRPSRVGKAILDIYKGLIPAIVQGGFNFVDVRDVADGIIKAMEKGRSGESYILGGDYYTLKQIAAIILKLKGSKKTLKEIPVPLAYIGLPIVHLIASLFNSTPIYEKNYLDILKKGSKFINSAKAKRELGYQSRPIETTLEDTISWFKKTGHL